jgi:hypothetical protein
LVAAGLHSVGATAIESLSILVIGQLEPVLGQAGLNYKIARLPITQFPDRSLVMQTRTGEKTS